MLPRGHSTEKFVYTYLTTKFTFSIIHILNYYLALIPSSHFLTLRLILVLYCHAMVKYGMQLLWVYLAVIAKYPRCSFCPHKTDCTQS